jgi:integrase/recombinase XerC
MLLSSAVDLFIASVCAGRLNMTPETYRKKLKRFTDFAGDVQIESIRPADVEHFRQSLLTQQVKRRGSSVVVAPLSPFYVRGVLRMVKYLFKWLNDEGYLTVNPATRLKLPKLPQVQPKAINQETFDKLLQAAAQSGEMWARARDVAFLCLLRDTGGRLGGLLSAHVSDLDLKGSRLQVTEKGDKVRDVFFGETTNKVLVRWLEVKAVLPARSDALFIGRHGAALSRSGVSSMLRRLAKAAEVEGQRYNPHSFRHAFARDALRAGADLSSVSQMMGHASVAVTGNFYARWLPSELQQIHQRTSPGKTMSDPLG